MICLCEPAQMSAERRERITNNERGLTLVTCDLLGLPQTAYVGPSVRACVCVRVYPLFACVYKRKKNPLNFNLKRVDKRLSRSDADADVDVNVDDEDDRLMSQCDRRPASTASGRHLGGRGRQGCQLVVKGRPSPPPPAGSPQPLPAFRMFLIHFTRHCRR